MWLLSFMGETWINHCVHALHTCCLTPEEHFAYFQLEKIVFSSFVCLFFCCCCFEKNGEKECYNCEWVRSGYRGTAEHRVTGDVGVLRTASMHVSIDSFTPVHMC